MYSVAISTSVLPYQFLIYLYKKNYVYGLCNFKIIFKFNFHWTHKQQLRKPTFYIMKF
jgi:hypothetical protein